MFLRTQGKEEKDHEDGREKNEADFKPAHPRGFGGAGRFCVYRYLHRGVLCVRYLDALRDR